MRRKAPSGSCVFRIEAKAEGSTALTIGRELRACGPYVIEAPLGKGGVGVVFRARHRETGAVCALKVIPAGAGSRTLERFRREAEMLVRVEGDPTIVRVHAAGVDQGHAWYAMDLIEGGSLASILETRGPLRPREAASLVARIARSLQRVHEVGVVHRDLKPGNVIMDASGAPRVVDFGIALDSASSRLTKTGEMVGTPAFMAPEQLRGEARAIGAWTDVYGLGAVLYASLTAQPPFQERDGFGLLQAILGGATPPLEARAPEVPSALASVCLRALARDPRDRFRTAGAFADALDAWLVEGRGVARAGRAVRGARGVAIAVLVALAAAGGAAALAVRGRDDRDARLDAAEATLAAGRSLGRGARAAIAAIETEPGGDDALVRRARLLGLIERALDVPNEEIASSESVAALAAALRGDGPATSRRLAIEALLARERFGLLDAVVHRAEPVLRVDAATSRALAEVTASGRDGLEPPLESAAFRNLYHAPGLPDEVRGRLLVRRAELGLASGRLPVAEVVRALVAARREHGNDGRLRIDADGVILLARAFIGHVEARRDDRAREVAWIASRVADEDRPDELPADLEPRFFAELNLARSADAAQLDAVFGRNTLILAFLVPLGLDLPDEGIVERVERFGAARYHALGRALETGPPEQLDPVGLLLAAFAVREEQPADSSRWLELALGRDPPSRRLLAEAARFLHLRNRDPERAGEAALAALEIDRRLPIERRWPAVGRHAATAFARRDPVAAEEVIVDADRVEERRRGACERFDREGRFVPAMWVDSDGIAGIARQLIRRRLDAGGACCGWAAELGGRPSVAVLLDIAVRRQTRFSGRFVNEFLLGEHARGHGRLEAALTHYDRALELRGDAVDDAHTITERQHLDLLTRHAWALRELGRLAEADEADRQLAEHVRAWDERSARRLEGEREER